MKIILSASIVFLCFACNTIAEKQRVEKPEFQKYTPEQERIISKYSDSCAKRHFYTYQMKEWQECLDKGLAIDSTISYLWQQKAMPLFKARKYEAGMVFLDRAVKYNPQKYLSYRAFIKCIFSKKYNEAIVDFMEAKKLHGNSYEMDHTYDFYIALSHLMLNEFDKAEEIFEQDIENQNNDFEDGAHYLDLFYYGVTLYELERFDDAIKQFDQALETYPAFSEVLLYKGLSLAKLDRLQEAEPIIKKAKEEGKRGNTINEDNVIYEMYPYQVKWHNH